MPRLAGYFLWKPRRLIAHSRARVDLGHSDFPQRIILGLVQTQNVAAVEALIPHLKVRAEGFRRA